VARIDLEEESPNVGHDGRANISPFEHGWLDPQVEEPTWSRNAALRHQLSVLQRKVRGR